MADNYFFNPDDRSGKKVNEILTKLEDFFKYPRISTLVVLSIIAGSLTGLVVAYQTSFTSFASEVDALAEFRPPEITKVYADDGKTLIGELALERRVPLEYEQIPEQLKQAILAIEDTRFYSHIGIDPKRMIGVAIYNLVTNRRAQGASTLTQQLARGIFLNRERTVTRKLKEIMYALQIERLYTKDQIMTLYCNQIFLGGGAYGFEAAANFYFSKHIGELSVDQYALLAALPKSHSGYSPIHRPKAALERRNLVIQAMVDAGFIERGVGDEAKVRPLGLIVDDQRGKNDRSPYAYFLEDVRQELQQLMVDKLKGYDALDVYKAGLSVYTTIDAKAQKSAVKVVRDGVEAYEARHGWKTNFYNIIDREGASLNTYRHPSWIGIPKSGEIATGLIKDVNDRGTKVGFGDYTSIITVADMGVLKRPPSKVFTRGDIAHFRIRAVDSTRKIVAVSLQPEPSAQAALVLLDAKTGEIKSMVGGYNFATNKFNHAVQGNRQTGSVFKPFVYAAAVEQGFRLDDIVDDSPFQRGDWTPQNYDHSFMGPISIRTALALSRNMPSIRVMDEVGVRETADVVKRLGLPNPMAPYLSSALGATEEPLLSMVSAYSTFPNSGVRMEPHRIRKIVNRDRSVIYEAEPQSYKVFSNYVAATMVELMKGPVQFGTARSASSLGHPVAGKTGTMDNNSDAWFIGYTPQVVCGIWIGFSDSKKTLGSNETGTTAALPFFIDFMGSYLKDKPKGKFPSIPDASSEMRTIQAQRARKHAEELARIQARDGDILPGGEGDINNIDPFGSGPEQNNNNPQNINSPAALPAKQDDFPYQNQKNLPQASSERKGKKGKSEEP